MAIPGRVDAAALLLSLDPPDWHLRHSRAVAEIAAWLAARIEGRGRALDRRLVEAAALLHDVDKLTALRADPAIARLPHGEGSAAWLAARGHPELGPIVAGHPVVRLADPAWAGGARPGASLEERVVAYADKRAGQRLESMAERFASWRRRYPPGSRADDGAGWDDATLERVHRAAMALEADVCATAGIAPDAVRRLPWTGTPLGAVRRTTGNRTTGNRTTGTTGTTR